MNYFEIILILIFIVSVASFLSLAPWVPTKKSDYKRIDDIIKLKPWEKFLEMWCWTSWVSLFIAKNNPHSKIIGVELSPFFYLISKLRILFSWLKNIEIKYWNALKLNLENYDIIYVFGLPETVTKKIFPKLSKIVNKKFRFVSYCFNMTNSYFKETKYKKDWVYAIYEYKL